MPDIRAILSLPSVYRAFWNLTGGRFKIFVQQHVRPRPGARVLDIGCGPGTAVPYFPNVEYVGLDASPDYIESARRRFPQATFVCSRVSHYTVPKQSYFDVVLAIGIVHHLDDVEARQLFEAAYESLKPNGKLVTLDGVLTKDQSHFARYLIGRDRGGYVRDQEGYIRIASGIFSHITPTVRQDLARFPYTHFIMECVR